MLAKLLSLLFSDMFSEPPLKVPMVYRLHRGSGRSISVVVRDDGLDVGSLILEFQRKIEPGDVKDGKLQPVTLEGVERRGGKRITSLALSLQSAEDLHLALGVALKDARKRAAWHEMSQKIMGFVFSTTQVHS